MTIAYLRVSTNKQDAENQRDEIIRFAQNNHLKIDKWHIEIISGKADRNKRKLNKLINRMKKGDTLIVSEMSRLSRLSFESIAIMAVCIKKQISLYSVKENYSCNNNLSSKIIGIFQSIFSEMERLLISQRTKEALAKKRSEGVVLGRPRGSSKIWKSLQKKRKMIIGLLESKTTKTKIAKILGISRVTLYKFIASI